ncbi:MULTISPECIES: contact-dependent growth inhibition system immunity protein [unclassified Nocardioides]|uniref:contact-dependent growth inhibition system immunity protein n=1 Tax=unclassified Nocardioides TaxID=2615069 RepID=UPI0006FCC7B6|nr:MULTISPECIES: contact-dependent growth inhibition system immunity protein [unclassified Nocardioides]KRA38784.1 hypothetical protein ASD81_09340 [Nocardioides sp. Root614]KRA92744.1 hypothetical protein ASD84_09605 [Nocardioides sp. Root682]
MIADEHPVLRTLLAAYLDQSVGEMSQAERIAEFVDTNDSSVVRQALADLDAVLSRPDPPTEEVQRLANHRLPDDTSTTAWLDSIRQAISTHSGVVEQSEPPGEGDGPRR